MGIPVEIWFGFGTLVLALVLVWATMQFRRRNRANDPIRDAATRDVYQHPTETTQRRDEPRHTRP